MYSFNLKILHTLEIGEGGRLFYNNIFLEKVWKLKNIISVYNSSALVWVFTLFYNKNIIFQEAELLRVRQLVNPNIIYWLGLFFIIFEKYENIFTKKDSHPVVSIPCLFSNLQKKSFFYYTVNTYMTNKWSCCKSTLNILKLYIFPHNQQ